MSGIPVVPQANQGDADAAQLARFGYGQELKRVLNLFEHPARRIQKPAAQSGRS
jgi:hypothetical protein